MNAERVLARRGRKFLRVRSGDRRRTQHTHFFTGTGTVQSGRRVISDDQSRTLSNKLVAAENAAAEANAAAMAAEAAKDEAVAEAKAARKEAADAADVAAALRLQVGQMRREAEAARDVGGVKRLLVAMGRLSADDLGHVTRHVREM